MSFRRLLLAATLLAAPLAAGAQPVGGLYLGAGAGLNFVPDANDKGVRLSTRDPGFAGVLSLGWGFGNGWRAEVEGNYRTDEVDRLSLNGARVGDSGTYDRYGAMANLLFDFDLSSFGIAPSMRASSVIEPFSSRGTLKSTRTRTRLPSTSRSSSVRN